MPSANLISTMNGIVRDTYQTNGLVRSHKHMPNTSSQTSLHKNTQASSPQYFYTKPNISQQANMQFSSTGPPVVPMVPPPSAHPSKTESVVNPCGPVTISQSQQQNPINYLHTSILPQSNGMASTNHSQQPATILMPSSSMTTTNNNSTHNTQQFQQIYQSQQQSYYQQQQQQNSQIAMAGSQANTTTQQQQQQQVPMTTIMIPSSAATQLQSASAQIQQAAVQAMASNPGQPQILVFMIPYMISQPPAIPPTPDQASLSGTNSLKHYQQNSSYHSSQVQQQVPQYVQQQSHTTVHTHSRAMSSVANSRVEPDKFYVKANFYYQSTRNKMELSFQKGDILHVIDTLLNSDYGRQYWLATRVSSDRKDVDKGLIPDKKRAEDIALEQRTLNMSEPGCGIEDSTSTSGVLSASVGRVNFLKRRAAQRSKSLCKDNWDNVVFDIGSLKLPAYERVIYKHPGFCRPVVIFGAMADFAREKLLRDYPERYSYPSGYNQALGHPKVIRLKGILEVIDQGKHALLDITPSAVEKLNFVNLAPIVIFMKTESKSIIKEFRSRAAQSLDPSARDDDTLRRDGKSSRKLLEQSIKLEKSWSHVFTVVLDLSMMGSEQWYRKLRATIEDQQSANVWMSDKKSDKKATSSSTSNINDMVFSLPNIQSSSSCVDDTNTLNEMFTESMSLTGRKNAELVPESIYGNRSQLRNAYAHSLAQKLARASSEPKLNGIVSENDDDDDDDDDEIIKKPIPVEYENSSSISSSNGATSYGHGSMTGSNISYQASFSHPQQQNQQQQQQQQQQLQHQQQQQQQPQTNHLKYDYGSLTRTHEGVYSRNSQLISTNGSYTNDGSSTSNSNYHLLPPMASDNGHLQQPQTNSSNNNVIDLTNSHETRSSAFQVYSDINQNNYHYYNLNKI